MKKSSFSPSNPIPFISLVDILTGLLENPEEKTRRQKITDLRACAKAIAFLQQHGISDLPSLREQVTEIRKRQNAVSANLKKVERRMKMLDEHIHNANIYFEHRALYKEYKQQKPKKQEAFYQKHRAPLTLYESAKQYLRKVMNGRTTIPVKAWKEETASLASEKKRLYAEYFQMKEAVRDAETIRRCMEQVLRENGPTRKMSKDKGTEQYYTLF